MKKVFLVLVAVVMFAAFGCGSGGGSRSTANLASDLDHIAPEDLVEFVPENADFSETVVFNDDVFNKYGHGFFETSGEASRYNNLLFFGKVTRQDARYGFEFFIFPKNAEYTSAIFLIDSIPMQNGRYFLLFSYFNHDRINNGEFSDAQVWLVNYSSDNEYIDSRMIYRKGSFGWHRFNIYSKLDLSENKFVIFDESGFGFFSEIPVIIRRDGTFEEFADIPFSTADIAITSCNSNGLHGKFPLNQEWTLISFYNNTLTKTLVNTRRNYFDELRNLNTVFVDRWEDGIYFDIAFKGVYEDTDVELMTLVAEQNDEIITLIEENLPDVEALEITTLNEIKVYSFTNDENKFWIAYCTINVEYTLLVGVTPDNKFVFLANYCVYEDAAKIFRLKNDFYLYVNETSCGEGSFGINYLYKLADDFEKIFEDAMSCD